MDILNVTMMIGFGWYNERAMHAYETQPAAG